MGGSLKAHAQRACASPFARAAPWRQQRTQRPEGLHEQQPAAAPLGGAELCQQGDCDGRASQREADDAAQHQEPLEAGRQVGGGGEAQQSEGGKGGPAQAPLLPSPPLELPSP